MIRQYMKKGRTIPNLHTQTSVKYTTSESELHCHNSEPRKSTTNNSPELPCPVWESGEGEKL